jgi:hypothetical protein
MTTSIAVAESVTPPITSPVDAEVDIEVLRNVPKQFQIDSDKAANWLVRKVLSARNYAIAVKEWAEREQRRAEREEHTLMFLFGNQLRGWATAECERQGGRRKSVPLPAGTVAFTQGGGNLVVDDEGAVLHWAKANCRQAVVVVERVSKTALKDHFKATGEQPDGSHVEPVTEKMYILPIKTALPSPESEKSRQEEV